MKGGYLEDRFVVFSMFFKFYSNLICCPFVVCRFNNGHTNRDAYRFYHWSFVDIFVYFSHHFITIPPIGWIVATHRNGVRCFGTILIEHWAQYVEDPAGSCFSCSGRQLITDLLLDHNQVDQITTSLANLAAYYRFDGWLVNIEAPMPVPKLFLMEDFLRLLTAKMKYALKLLNDDIAVIWYDSVTTDNGKLDWQNELNAKNVRFFKACDGIFLNYCWNVGHLQKSRQMLNEDREIASKQHRIFVGVDIFGRGCMGGGGFSSDVALAEIHKANLSVALFAPGWTYEVLGTEKFEQNERQFWSKLAAYLPERYPRSLPLRTSFCQGFGDRLFKQGELICPLSWYNLAEQQLQPSFQRTTTDANFEQHCFITTEDAFQGGSCLRYVLPVNGPEVTIFRCVISLQNKSQLQYSIITKKNHHPAVIQLVSGLAFRNISSQLQLAAPDKYRALRVPELFSKSIYSIHGKSARISGDWKRDEFVIKFHPKHNNDLTLSSINISIRLARDSQERDEDASPLDYGHFEVLVGQLSLE